MKYLKRNRSCYYVGVFQLNEYKFRYNNADRIRQLNVFTDFAVQFAVYFMSVSCSFNECCSYVLMG